MGIFVIVIDDKIVAEFDSYDKAYAEFRKIALTTKKDVILKHK